MRSIFGHNVVEVVTINLKIPVIILVGDPLCVSDVSEILTKSEFNLFTALELDESDFALPDRYLQHGASASQGLQGGC